MRIGLLVKYPLLLSDFNEAGIFSKKILKYHFHENPSSGSRVVPFGQTDRHNEAVISFRNFANAPKNK
jgi:hypothetical protein